MPIYNILDFGAAGDGTDNDAAAIQRAIDACTRAGGGTVFVPAGKTFRTGTIELKSNVELHVERGAVLAGATISARALNKARVTLNKARASQRMLAKA
jgi:polygalacturonase